MEQISKHIKLLSNGKYTLPYCNCLLIEDDINCLVDSSPPREEAEHLQEIKIELIVNSHGHSDHNSRNYSFSEARVLLHPTEHERVSSGESYLKAYGFDLYPAEDVRPLYLDAVKYHPRPADGELHDRQVISTGNTVFEVIHLPGHSSGHCGFIFPKEGFIFTADIHVNIPPFYAMIDSSVDDFVSSIKRLRSLQPDMLIAGHGKAVLKGNLTQRLDAYLDKFYKRDEEILKRIKAGKHTIREIAEDGITYEGRFPEPRSVYLLHECIMDWKHLQRLEKIGEVIAEDNRYFIK
ncbi:MAG: MBL fold metallo-hydrolase [Candidatus Saccharibacteria bacterium]